MAVIREAQQITAMLNLFLEIKGYNKAAVARKANIDPEALYAMLKNRKIMTADSFIDICRAIDTSTSEIIQVVKSEHEPITNRPA